jgi:arylsulfatase A-like enzyme
MRVLLIVVDTMRADHAGCYGYPKPTTPNLDRLAAEGALFTDCYATDVPTIPAFTALLTGRRGVSTGVVSHDHPESIITPETRTLPDVLAKAGVVTGAVSSLFTFKRWIAKGFSHFMQPDQRTPATHITASQVNELALPWMRAHARRDFFLMLHYWDPHSPYSKTPAAYARRFYEGTDPRDPANMSLAGLWGLELMSFYAWDVAAPQLQEGVTDLDYLVAEYDGGIALADDYLGQLLEGMEDAGLLEDTLLIFTSDHGEAFGEHGVYFDHMDAYEQTARVPLVVTCPGRAQARRSEALTQSIDIAPTVLEAFDVPAPEAAQGRSLWPVLRGETDEHRAEVVTNQGLWSAQRSFRTREWSYVETLSQGMLGNRPPRELFDRRADPAEARNLIDDRRDVSQHMEARLRTWLDNELQGRDDPLRLAGEASVAPEMVRRKLKERRKADDTPWVRQGTGRPGAGNLLVHGR